MDRKLLRIEVEDLDDHHYLTEGDQCFYFGIYTSYRGYSHSETNQLIENLKKCPSKRGTREYDYYKMRAIHTVAHLLTIIDPALCTFIPTPPSTARNHPKFDDRLGMVLSEYGRILGVEIDVREAVTAIDSKESAAGTDNRRPRPEDLMDNYQVDENMLQGMKEYVIIFDDILASGSHYRAMKEIISDYTNDHRVVGLFPDGHLKIPQ